MMLKKSYVPRCIILYMYLDFFISSLFVVVVVVVVVSVWIYNDVLRQGDQKKKKKFLMNLQSRFGSLSFYFFLFCLFLLIF